MCPDWQREHPGSDRGGDEKEEGEGEWRERERGEGGGRISQWAMVRS